MATPARPPLATAAAVLLIIVGALNIIAGIGLLSGYGTVGTLFGVIGLGIGAASLFAGIQVLGLNEQGRTVGIVVAGIGAAFNIYGISQGVTPQVIGLLINVFIIYALINTQTAFRKV